MDPDPGPFLADTTDADQVAALLHDFNVEFETPSPGPEAVAARLRSLLATDSTFAVLAGRPDPVAVGVVTLRPNVWFDGPVALLDELYVVPSRRGGGVGGAVLRAAVDEARARGAEYMEINVDESDVDAVRFYLRHGFSDVDPDSGERAWYLSRYLDG